MYVCVLVSISPVSIPCREVMEITNLNQSYEELRVVRITCDCSIILCTSLVTFYM